MAQRFELYDDNGDPLPNSIAQASPQLVGVDAQEWAKMQPFAPRAQGEEDAPWWQSIVKYGAIKAIDNTLPGRSPGVQGNTYPGSFAGQNGQTYQQVGPITAPPQLAAGGGVMGMSMPTLLLLGVGLAVAAFVAFR